ncbi:MAG: HsdM family class I SAM-dependent methyltransferase [Myxococcota bacterium]
MHAHEIAPLLDDVAAQVGPDMAREALYAAELRRRGAPDAVWDHAPPRVDAPRLDADLAELHQQALALRWDGTRFVLDPAGRRASGSFYTPPDVVEHLLDLARCEGRVLDPSCGAGRFVLAAARRVGARNAFGVDTDALAVAICRAGIADLGGDPRQVRLADALLSDLPDDFDLVVGNPPFLDQLDAASALPRDVASALKARLGDVVSAYADVATLFLVRGLRLCRPGGRVAMIQPASLLAAQHAAAARRALGREGALVALWWSGEDVFDAQVRVCAPVIERGAEPGPVRVVTGRAFAHAGVEAPLGDTWAPLVAFHLPPARARTRGRLGDVATATADFRDEYYGLRGAVVEAPDGDLPKLVTTGLVDPCACKWGRAPAHLHRVAYTHPRVDLDRLAPKMRAWAARRGVPKVLVATQTRVIEAWVDADGACIGTTPMISVFADDPWKVAAVLLSPFATRWALENYGGTGMSEDVVKLAARQVLEIPLPDAPWDAAAELVRRAHAGEPGALEAAALAMDEAYGVELRPWWAQRLGRARIRTPKASSATVPSHPTATSP